MADECSLLLGQNPNGMHNCLRVSARNAARAPNRVDVPTKVLQSGHPTKSDQGVRAKRCKTPRNSCEISCGHAAGTNSQATREWCPARRQLHNLHIYRLPLPQGTSSTTSNNAISSVLCYPRSGCALHTYIHTYIHTYMHTHRQA